MGETIHIFHTNDLHSHLENWPKIRRYLLGRQAQYHHSTETTFTFDIGDCMDRVHPLSEATNGQANIELMNQVHYDGVTIGNNEGIGNTHDELEHLYDHANFPVILGNLREATDGQLAHFAQPYEVLESKGHTKLGVIGLTAPFILTYVPNQWQPQLIQTVLPGLIDQLQPQVDYIILLSHLGLDMDRYIAAHYPEIGLIIGSHTHHLLPVGEMDEHTFLTAAGKYGQYIGDITLKFDDHHQLIDETAKVIKTATLPPESGDEAEIDGYLIKGHDLLKQQVIADLPTSLPIRYVGRSPLIELGLKALKDYTKTEAAILNAGLFLDSLPAGPVTADDLHRILPHPMRIMKVTLSGTELWRLIREMEKNRNYLRVSPIKGMGFRGKIFGELVYDGISYDAATRTVKWNGELIDPTASYTFSTVDHYLYIPYFPTIEIVGENEIMFPYFLRNVVRQYLSKIDPVKR